MRENKDTPGGFSLQPSICGQNEQTPRSYVTAGRQQNEASQQAYGGFLYPFEVPELGYCLFDIVKSN